MFALFIEALIVFGRFFKYFFKYIKDFFLFIKNKLGYSGAVVTGAGIGIGISTSLKTLLSYSYLYIFATFVILLDLYFMIYMITEFTFSIFNNLSLYDFIISFISSEPVFKFSLIVLKKLGILDILNVSFYITISYFVFYQWKKIITMILEKV